MKHISAFYDNVETAHQCFAWWPVRSSFSKKIIWLKNYVRLDIHYDTMGMAPKEGINWSLVYTPGEYTVYLLKKMPKT